MYLQYAIIYLKAKQMIKQMIKSSTRLATFVNFATLSTLILCSGSFSNAFAQTVNANSNNPNTNTTNITNAKNTLNSTSAKTKDTLDAQANNGSNPKVLAVAFASIEDNALYDQVYSKFIYHLRQCMNMPVLVYPIYQESQVLSALKEGKVHLASLGTGATLFAVNEANAVPFATRGTPKTKQNETYDLLLLTKAGTSYKAPQDLRGLKIAHTTLTSNSGNLAPRALFPDIGLTPDVNYVVAFSGRHDKSILGVKNGFYEGAAVASDVFERMIMNQQIKANEFNILWRSQPFPTNSFSHNAQLNPSMVKQVKNCFFNYRFPDAQSRLLNGHTIFIPANYQKNWAGVRYIYAKAKNK